ncbi:MAG: hypothetical protein A2V66_10565 [Ignavibacteria bacterium RBG_13_36_8]|nr:MAG: hypothetical protein A2V66_10565 [Ignavibacteria bacterium RBG_13_36_8]
MRILVLVNWGIKYLSRDDQRIQSPDKSVNGERYWFFKYWPEDVLVDVVDYSRLPYFHTFEKKILKVYIWQALIAALKVKGYDLIISHGAQSGIVLAFLRTLFGNRNPPHIIIDIGCFNGARENLLETLPIEFGGRSLSGIIYHSKVQLQYYKKHFNSLLPNIQYIPFGVDTDFFSPMDVNEENIIVAFGFKKRDYITLCHAWELLKPTNVTLKIIGIKTPPVMGLRELPNGVDIYDAMSIDDLKNVIARALFIAIPLPYYNYSYGQMSLLQSMSMGKAVIITKTPGVIDYVRDNVDALFVRPYDVDDMKEKISHLLRHPDKVREIGDRARRATLDTFSEELMSRRMYDFVQTISI